MPTSDIVSEIYKAWRAQDLDRAVWFFADDFCHTIHIPQNIHPLGGVREGKQAAVERLQHIMGQFEFLAYDVDNLMGKGLHAAAEVQIHYRHKLTSLDLKTTIAHFWTLRQGRVVNLTEYHDLEQIQEFSERSLARI